ncbi:MAG: hypothetical protein ACI9LU_000052 [Polaribacter sp.]|jgi:hypothetical protein
MSEAYIRNLIPASEYGRVVFRGRYKTVLVDSDEHLLHLSKYIHKNTIEVKIIENLAAYQ